MATDIKTDLQEILWQTRTGLIQLRIGEVAGFCEHGNETSGSLNWRERGISPLVTVLRASQDELCSRELVLSQSRTGLRYML